MELQQGIEVEKLVWFRTICLENGLELSLEQIELIGNYVNLLIEWNRKINLISRKDEENVWDRHILHSIIPFFHFHLPENSVIVDVGTGGGLPGIPLKIVLPKIRLLCIDAIGKKIKAVGNMIEKLKLHDVETIWGRAEKIALLPEYNQKFDYVVARSVSSLVNLIEWTSQFLKRETNKTKRSSNYSPALLIFKGGDLTAEIGEAKKKFKNVFIEERKIEVKGIATFEESVKKFLIVRNI